MNRSFICLAIGIVGLVSVVAAQLRGGHSTLPGPPHRPVRPPAGTWAPLTNQPPNSNSDHFTASEIFLMTDGSVLCMALDSSVIVNNDNTLTYFADPSVWKLTPDVTGS